MLPLPNNCRAGNFSVFPNNWKSSTANPRLKWRITFWFYDDNLKEKKQVRTKAMNKFSKLSDKQDCTKWWLEEYEKRMKEGFNFFNKEFVEEKEISESTGLLSALNYAFEHVELNERTRIDVKNSFKYIAIAIRKLRFENLAISKVKPKHIKFILDGCGEIKTYTDGKGQVKPRAWGSYQFNRYRTYLSLLIGYLIDQFVIDSNPVRDVKKQQQLIKIRDTVTKEQREKLRELVNVPELYTFFRFMNIYYHSSRRITELLAVKKEHVRLEEHKFKVTMKKGKKYTELWATIEKAALPFWEEVYNEAEPGQYLFGLHVKPEYRDKPPTIETVSRRWNRHVKKKMGITADLASLRHTHLDEISEMFGVKKAQEAAGHSTPVVTMKHYLVGQKERDHEEAKRRESKL
jgi:integrase